MAWRFLTSVLLLLSVLTGPIAASKQVDTAGPQSELGLEQGQNATPTETEWVYNTESPQPRTTTVSGGDDVEISGWPIFIALVLLIGTPIVLLWLNYREGSE